MTPQSITVPAAAVRGALDRMGLKPEPHSPLAALAAAPADASAGAGGLKDAGWLDALATLARPERRIRCVLPGPASLFEAAWYGRRTPPGDAPLVSFSTDGAQVRLAAPAIESDVVHVVARALLANPFTPADAFTASFSAHGLSAFAAAIDAVRAGMFASLLDRRPDAAFALSNSHLRDQIQDGSAHPDPRWLVALLRLLCPAALAPDPSRLDAGIPELVAAGLLAAAGDKWTPAPKLLQLAAGWRSPLPAAAVEALEWTGAAVRAAAHVVAIRGDGSLWTLEVADAAGSAARVALRCRDGTEFVQSLRMLLSDPPAVSPPLAHPVEATRACAKCGTKNPAHAKFCMACGAPA